jgi:hypothetical protein
MSEQALHSPSVVAFPNKEDELDKAGQAACDLVHQQPLRPNKRPNMF